MAARGGRLHDDTASPDEFLHKTRNVSMAIQLCETTDAADHWNTNGKAVNKLRRFEPCALTATFSARHGPFEFLGRQVSGKMLARLYYFAASVDFDVTRYD